MFSQTPVRHVLSIAVHMEPGLIHKLMTGQWINIVTVIGEFYESWAGEWIFGLHRHEPCGIVVCLLLWCGGGLWAWFLWWGRGKWICSMSCQYKAGHLLNDIPGLCRGMISVIGFWLTLNCSLFYSESPVKAALINMFSNEGNDHVCCL